MSADWGYSHDNGPHAWVEWFPSAAGTRQSPVDIITNQSSSTECSRPLAWRYSPQHTRSVVNPGHCWRVDENGKGSELTGGPLGDHVYRLEQFHCHWGRKDGVGSEHTVDGASFSGELHLVHWNTTKYASFGQAAGHPDGLAVLGVFLSAGARHAELDKVVRLLPYVTHKGDKITMSEPFDPSLLLPAGKTYWTYAGSLTTPPCTECVTWIIFKEPVEVSPEQLAMMRRLRRADASASCDTEGLEVLHNHRPPLPLGSRELREYGNN